MGTATRIECTPEFLLRPAARSLCIMHGFVQADPRPAACAEQHHVELQTWSPADPRLAACALCIMQDSSMHGLQPTLTQRLP